MTYAEKLRDPRWQRRRLEIMERDGWACRKCSTTTKPLNVHHVVYFDRLEPWNYPDHLLITLCDDDHKEEESGKSVADAQLVETIRGLGAMNSDIDRLIQMIRESHAKRGSAGTLALLTHHLDAMWQEAQK